MTAALFGLVGVLVGAAITTITSISLTRASRRHEFIERQIREFYAPLVGLRREIRTKSEFRLRISEAADATWRQLCSGQSVDAQRETSRTRSPEFEKIIKYDNKQLGEELLPDYRRMIQIFKTHGWLAEESTLKHYPTLIEFVELWNRSEAGALPWEVMERIGHHESKLTPLYNDIEEHLGRLREFVASGKT